MSGWALGRTMIHPMSFSVLPNTHRQTDTCTPTHTHIHHFKLPKCNKILVPPFATLLGYVTLYFTIYMMFLSNLCSFYNQ